MRKLLLSLAVIAASVCGARADDSAAPADLNAQVARCHQPDAMIQGHFKGTKPWKPGFESCEDLEAAWNDRLAKIQAAAQAAEQASTH